MARTSVWGSDPLDASSENRPPGDNLCQQFEHHAENSAIGTVIGEFNATDPDGDTNLAFSIVPYPARLWLDAADAEKSRYPFGWQLGAAGNARASSQHDAVAPGGFHGRVRYLPDGLGDSLPAIDSNGSSLTVLDSNVSFDECGVLSTKGMVCKSTKVQ